jgi:hypothetical protein
VLSWSALNTVVTGGSSMTLFGVNFGVVDASTSTTMGRGLCQMTSWYGGLM